MFVGTLLIVIPGPVFTLGPDDLEPPLDAEGADALPRAPRGGGGCDGRPRLLEADLMSMFPILMLGIVTTLDSLILFRVVKKRLSTSRLNGPRLEQARGQQVIRIPRSDAIEGTIAARRARAALL